MLHQYLTTSTVKAPDRSLWMFWVWFIDHTGDLQPVLHSCYFTKWNLFSFKQNNSLTWPICTQSVKIIMIHMLNSSCMHSSFYDFSACYICTITRDGKSFAYVKPMIDTDSIADKITWQNRKSGQLTIADRSALIFKATQGHWLI